MLIHGPIFINAFARGGSSLLWNLLESHPDVCSSIRETHRAVLWDGPALLRSAGLNLAGGGLLPRPEFEHGHVLLNAGVMSVSNYRVRHFPAPVRRYLDRRFHARKMENLTHPDYRFKFEGVPYTEEEVRAARFVSKNINGIVFLTDEFQRMYPDATFVAFVRNGLALAESRMRRGTFRSADKFAVVYRRMVEKMLADQQRLPNYHVLRFEDMAADPVGFLRDLYRRVGLDPAPVERIHVKAKTHVAASPAYATSYEPGHRYWIDVDELPRFINRDIDRAQVSRIGAEHRDAFLRVAGPVMSQLGYDV